MTELEKFKKYWDRWHKEWKERVMTTPLDDITPIGEWPFPKKQKRNDNKIWNYFPEPYWGGHRNNLSAVFLSINPGRTSFYQNIKFEGKDKKIYNQYYQQLNYRQITKIISKDESNYTINWMNDRIEWLKDVLRHRNIKLNLDNVLLADLVPWHTTKKSSINWYFKLPGVNESIINKVLLPVIEISKTIKGPLKGKVIVRGSNILDLFNEENSLIKNFDYPGFDYQGHSTFVILNEDNDFKKFRSLLTVIKINDVSFFVFSGGPSMDLPKIDSIVRPINNKTFISKEKRRISLKEFLLKSF